MLTAVALIGALYTLVALVAHCDEFLTVVSHVLHWYFIYMMVVV